MARVKGGMNAKKKHNRTLKLAKGYRGARSKQYKIAKQSVMRALARMNGLSYSKMMHGLKVAGVDINRKILADMAINDAEGFATLAELAKSKIA